MDMEKEIYNHVKEYEISDSDLNRPWGRFYYVDSSQTQKFIKEYFSMLDNITYDCQISPKFLIINPRSRLSWQYHHRRQEIWKIIKGPVGVVRSFTDKESDTIIHQTGDIVTLACEERHRLVGLDNYAIIAELWIHADNDNPSSESDIVRINDDYSRQ
jgi:mannose-6-phosphate isomerase-like protein (cupin superfamily)